MNTSTDTREMEWSMVQMCGECGTDAAFLRHPVGGEAICRNCSHEHPMDPWNLDDGEVFEWWPVAGDSVLGSVARVLHVTCYV